MDIGWLPLAAFILTAIGWLSREIWRWRKVKRLATEDAVSTLNQKRALIESLISKADDSKDRNNLIAQLDEVNAALLGLYTKRLRNTLKEAGLPTEDALIADGQSRLNPQEVAQLSKVIEEVNALPLFLSAQDLLVLGNAHYYMNRYQDAKNIFDQLLKLNPDDVTILFNRGTAYANLGKYEEALADFNRYLELKPDNAAALSNRGGVYKYLERYEEAFADFNRSLKLKPDDAIALANRGGVNVDLEKYAEALVDLNRALEITPNKYVALVNRGILYTKLRKYAEALVDFDRTLELSPDNPEIFYNLACLFSLWGKADNALTYLEKALDKDKRSREKASSDKDFDNIRDDPRFKKLTESD